MAFPGSNGWLPKDDGSHKKRRMDTSLDSSVASPSSDRIEEVDSSEDVDSEFDINLFNEFIVLPPDEPNPPPQTLEEFILPSPGTSFGTGN